MVKVAGEKVTGPLQQVGMAFQAPTLLPWRTTLDNVMLPLEIVEPYRSTLRARRDEYVARARELLRTVGWPATRTVPWQLSGGMQQRASICRALIHQPRMLLLDEPFGALDAFTREELWCVLRDLWQAQRFNVIPVTHDLREAVFLADTVYVMSQRPGRILLRKEIDLPRPRDLDLTYTEPFAELRARAAREDRPRTPALMMTMTSAQQRRVQRVAPWILLGAVLLLWQGACLVFDVSDFILPSPASIATALFQYWDVIGPRLAHLLDHHGGLRAGHRRAWCWAWRMGLAPGLCRGLPADDGLQRAAQGRLRAHPMVWFGLGVGPAILTAFLISFFPIMVNIATGLATLEPELEDVLWCSAPSAATCCSRSACRVRCRSSSPR